MRIKTEIEAILKWLKWFINSKLLLLISIAKNKLKDLLDWQHHLLWNFTGQFCFHFELAQKLLGQNDVGPINL